MQRVDLDWQGPYKLTELSKVNDYSKDHGIYQVYGFHPIYGSNVLMYIGLAAKQIFYQ
ncbi:hypothetical protein PV403_05425 [Paenibacillus sp. GYB006]|uniref:hypothetical protein n=1 Tax=Paenibacillus sp. GYB006 TaxID=2994394 RepID=UPI002F964E27